MSGADSRDRRQARRWLPLAAISVIAVASAGAALGRRLDPTRHAAAFCDPAVPAGIVGAPVPPFAAVDQDGNRITDRDFHGNPWIADFIFTSCMGSCPVLTRRLVALQASLPGVPVRFVSFSVDPAHDTPPVMKAYATRWHGDPVRWRLLVTDGETLARVGAALGGAEDPSAAGTAFHSDRFALVDGAGRLLGLYSSASEEQLARLRRDLQAALPRTQEAPAARTIAVRPAGAKLP